MAYSDHSAPTLTTVLTAFGALIVTYYAYNIFSFLYLFLFHRSTISRYLHPPSTSAASSTSEHRSWALITGASDGIGMGFAYELASKGFNIILHGRSPTKLAAVETALKAQYPQISTRLFVLDAYPCSVAAIDDYIRGLAEDGLSIRILVNNIGGGALVKPTFRPLTKLTAEDVQKLFDLNVGFPTLLTRALLPVVQEPALVLNLGSFASDIPAPWLTVYAGSKAFNLSWSRSLGVELRAEGKDVEVMGLLVGEVQTAGHPGPVGLFICSSRTLARNALAKVGCGRHTVVPWWRHAVILALVLRLPETLLNWGAVRASSSLKEGEKRHLEANKRNL
ncbi:NAD(P)-binding protein [Mycena sanguinolenta]|uniref:NAD(P)-binding protein n=1 Tax=Mycena sanguinolenta TaxID=230812 RepID=A0A8H6XYL7_9AGAR|nr:NAD(P)-binding protein [Mycena sanguinolenta]